MPTPPDRVPVRRALLSVSDKTGLLDFARSLADRGVELISTGGTAKAIAEAGIAVTPIEQVTGFPEMLDGRVKTLHPAVHGAILGRTELDTHASAMAEHGIVPIDLVCVNLYPFEQTVARPDATYDEIIEQIDIGGPSMVRSAAKNHGRVAVVTEPSQYARVLAELDATDGATTCDTRRALAAEAFARTAAYDAAIAAHLAPLATSQDDPFPNRLTLAFEKLSTLRYGENPHQSAAVYRDAAYAGPTVVDAPQHSGKPLSFNNIADAAAALDLVIALHAAAPDHASACVVKHTNPCGAAVAPDALTAITAAVAGDPLAAYGGILAVSRPIDADAAAGITNAGSFFEVIVAPSFDPAAVEKLAAKWPNVRTLAIGPLDTTPAATRHTRPVPGGLLVQDADAAVPTPAQWTHAAGPAPDQATIAAAALLEPVCRALSSNTVCIGGPDGDGVVRLFGAGAGQMDRVAACRLAVEKAGEKARGAIVFSDAFFPFPDGPSILADAGVAVIVHPGGSKRDSETFALCDERGITCMTTGVRHFRH